MQNDPLSCIRTHAGSAFGAANYVLPTQKIHVPSPSSVAADLTVVVAVVVGRERERT